MTWRTVIISSNSKLDLKLCYLIIRGSEIKKIHLSEISVLIIESTAVSLTTALLCEMNRRKIKVVFCDEYHNPYGELVPLYGSHDSTEKMRNQIAWTYYGKCIVWKRLVEEKIKNQARHLIKFDYKRSIMLTGFSNEVEEGDSTNREGHAAKVYFNTLLGVGNSRKDDSEINSLLNYGYSVMMSAINREVTALGYKSELGIKHDNVFNHFNLGCDLIEPLRPMVDKLVFEISPCIVNKDSKHRLADVLNTRVMIDGKNYFLNNALPIYVKSVIDAVEKENPDVIKMCTYEI